MSSKDDALAFACKRLLPRIRKIFVTVRICNMDVDADVDQGYDDREYVIRINRKLAGDDLLTAIFHEMVHIKQDIRKEYPVFLPSTIPYYDRPWEIEAYKMQEVLLLEYQKHINNRIILNNTVSKDS